MGPGAILVVLRGRAAQEGLACDVGRVLRIVGFTWPKLGKIICIPDHEWCCSAVLEGRECFEVRVKQASRGTRGFLFGFPEESVELVPFFPQMFGAVKPVGLDLFVCVQGGKVLTKISVSKGKGLSGFPFLSEALLEIYIVP